MKKSNTLFQRAMLTIAFYLTLGVSINAAPICGPVWPDAPVGSGSTGMWSTGNDVAYNGCDWLRVQVYSGTNPGLSWQADDYCTGGGYVAGASPFALTDAIDPDVVLVQDQISGIWYAIAVYYSPSANRYFMNSWQYTAGSGFTDLGPQTIDGASVFGTTINIDANAVGEFMIVWDNANASVIRAQGGYTDAGIGPYLCGGFTDLPNTNGGYNHPDVAIAENSSGPGAAHVHFTYTYPALDKILVTLDKQWYICNNLPNYIVEWGTSITNMGDAFVEPRIACPNANGQIDDWSVVWLYIDNTNFFYDVQGATNFSGSVVSHYYTDGSQIPTPDPQGQYHKRPCVAYSGYGTTPQDGIQISWTTAWPSVTPGTTIIGLQLDLKGFVVGSCYQIAPQSVPADAQDISSLAGRHSKFMTSCYYDWAYTGDILTKDFFWFTGFRIGETTDETTAAVGITPNPSGNEVQLNITSLATDAQYSLLIADITGRTILATSGTVNDIKERAEKTIVTLTSGAYMVRINSSDKGQVLAQKIVRY